MGAGKSQANYTGESTWGAKGWPPVTFKIKVKMCRLDTVSEGG